MVEQLTADSVQKSHRPIVIMAFATWCPHCAKMEPLFKQLDNELGKKYMFATFDVDQFPELTQQFNVVSLPTFIFIKDKKEVARVIGEMTQADLKMNIEKNLA